MFPGVVASVPSCFRRPWFGGITRQPAKDVVVVELFGPQQTGEGLALHQPLVSIELRRMDGVIELICLRDAPGKNGIEIRKGSVCAAALKRTSTVKLLPGARMVLASPASLLPCWALTQPSAKPFTTASLIPSFTWGAALGAWNSRSALVSFS